MLYKYKLYDPITGKTIIYEDKFDWPDEELMLFQWLENNYSCDCNRRHFMYGMSVEHTCGEEVQLLEITRSDGSVVEI